MNEEKRQEYRATAALLSGGPLLTIRQAGEAGAEGAKTQRLEGYAIVWDSPSRMLCEWDEDEFFIETIARDALSDEVLAGSDVTLNVDHDMRRMLARWRMGTGSLELRKDETGLWFGCDLASDDLSRSVAEHVARGDFFGCSFCFSFNRKLCTYGRNADGILTRQINEITQLTDVSVVRNPAYMATSATASERAYWGALVTEPEPKKRAAVDVEAYFRELEKGLLG